ncbi:MAG: nucleotidyltransferase family protein [Thermodesulfobacteriota bacterium]|nr:nucleotidyltransferase family protein [Thermodesulfobacteriota bacterium]
MSSSISKFIRLNEWPLSPEESLLILASKIKLDADDSARMEVVVNGALDWSVVMRYADALGMNPLLYKHLSQMKSAFPVPEDVMRLLKKRYRRESIRNLRIYGQLNQILEALNRSGSPIILLKGILLAKWVYGDIGLRPMNDIDILCRQEDAHTLRSTLVGLGYTEKTIYQGPLQQSILAEESMHLPPFHKPGFFMVEVHTNLFTGTCDDFSAMKMLWDNAVPLELYGKLIHCLSPEYQLLYLSIHLYRHIIRAQLNLFWFCDIHEFIGAHKNEINWEGFWSMADSLGEGSNVETLFDLLARHWNTQVPEKLLFSRGGDIGKLNLRAIIRGGCDKNTPRVGFLADYVRKLKGVRKIEGWKNRSRYLMRYFWPERGYLMDRYHITNTYAVPLYYALHPCILFNRAIVSLLYNVVSIFRNK